MLKFLKRIVMKMIELREKECEAHVARILAQNPEYMERAKACRNQKVTY